MFKGSFVALITPMQANGQIDYPSVERLLDMHIAAGTNGIVVAGSTGESMTLSQQEKLLLVKFVVERVGGQLPVIAGSNAHATQATIELSQAMANLGADACLISTPASIKPMQQGLYEHYRAIAHALSLPIILYNSPDRNMCDLLPATIAKLSSIPNIVALKETVDATRVNDVKRLCHEQLVLLSGDDAQAFDMMRAGAQGVISVTANIAPKAVRMACEAVLSGHIDQAKAMSDTLRPLHKALFLESNPIPVKWAAARLKLISKPTLRMPLTTFGSNYQHVLLAAMENSGIIEAGTTQGMAKI